MKKKAVFWITVGIAIVGSLLFSVFEKDEMEIASSPSSVFSLTTAELKRLQGMASAGDCQAALKVSRHHTFWTRQYDESVNWLRLAAKCDDVSPKKELILMLIDLETGSTGPEEIDALLAQITNIDPVTGVEYKKLVASRRARRPP